MQVFDDRVQAETGWNFITAEGLDIRLLCLLCVV
jgi:hypothetical protein